MSLNLPSSDGLPANGDHFQVPAREREPETASRDHRAPVHDPAIEGGKGAVLAV